MRTVSKAYRVNGSDTYQITYQETDGNLWTIWCTQHPENPYSQSAQQCHLYGSGQICVTAGKEPRSLDKAIAIAQVWMNGFSQYVRTGVFPNGGCRVNV